MTLGERSNITGNLSYTSENELIRAAGALVGGKTVQNQPTLISSSVAAKDVLVPFLVILFAALIWYLLFSRFLVKVSPRSITIYSNYAHRFRNIFLNTDCDNNFISQHPR